MVDSQHLRSFLVGFLRIDSVDHTEASKSLVGRRFIAVKGAMICIYKEEKDFVDDAPVVELEMKLACIKVTRPPRY